MEDPRKQIEEYAFDSLILHIQSPYPLTRIVPTDTDPIEPWPEPPKRKSFIYRAVACIAEWWAAPIRVRF
jgi:hypothetical protein